MDKFISMVRRHSAQYLKKTNKFEHELPKMVNEGFTISEKIVITLWQGAIQKEMENVKIAWQIIPKARSHQMGFSMSIALLCLILKWRISKEKHA